MIEKYYNEKDEVGVIVSPGYGAGFSTWASNKEICFDKEFIELILKNDEEGLVRLKEEKYPDDYFEYRDLKVEFVPKGTIFEISEYDGSEYLRIISFPQDFLIA